MIAKIHSGQGFAGLVDYANDIKNKKADIIASEGKLRGTCFPEFFS